MDYGITIRAPAPFAEAAVRVRDGLARQRTELSWTRNAYPRPRAAVSARPAGRQAGLCRTQKGYCVAPVPQMRAWPVGLAAMACGV
jgi:hypothetical protein